MVFFPLPGAISTKLVSLLDFSLLSIFDFDV
jgi:hypothetical protein